MHATAAPPIGRLLTAPELAEKLGSISRDRLFELAREGKIPHCRIGRSVRFDVRAVGEWLERGGTAEPGE